MTATTTSPRVHSPSKAPTLPPTCARCGAPLPRLLVPGMKLLCRCGHWAPPVLPRGRP